MSPDLRQDITASLKQKSTEELVEIWKTNDCTEWTEMAFEAVRLILLERQVELPPQNEALTIAVKEEQDRQARQAAAGEMTFLQFYFSLNGRVSLASYWLKGVLPLLIISIIVGFIEGDVLFYSNYSGAANMVWRLVMIWPAIALTVKRWHDRDLSGVWIFVGLIPVLGTIYAFIENCFLPGTDGPNQYGAKGF